ncbi:MAG: serine/threonine protein phosphatase [Clostridia bacterium]|nr:serine/threonine protein phosphatase [Clostridia bacterium]
MSIYAIADLHLSFQQNKPMDIFGENWMGHEEKIRKNWIERVNSNDVVLLPGDFSWATYLQEAKKDFEFLSSLPGKKLMLKGNHDYWWTTVASMKKFLQENDFKDIDFIYNNAHECDGYIITGTRGWSTTDEEDNEKMINRELIRLELSLKDGINKYGTEKDIIVCMHYPPITNIKIVKNEELAFVKMMKKYNVKKCLYGHLHSDSIKEAVEGNIDGIEYKLVSADGLDFELYKL